MTHNNFLSRLTHFVANGRVSTPPCNSHGFLRVFTDGEPTANRQRIDSECCRGLTDGRPTVEYAVQHTLRYAFLLLTFLLLTPSNMWGRNFYEGDVLYIDLSFPMNDGKSYNIMEFGRCDFNLYHDKSFDHGIMGEQIPGTSIVKFVFVEKNMATGDKGKTFLGKGPSYETYKIKVQNPDGTTMRTTGTLDIDNDRTKNYIKSGSWGTYTEPAPTLDNDYYVFGAGGTDWVTGWSTAKWNDDYKLNTSGNVASKTFYNVKGDCLFKIWKKSNDSQLKFNAVDNSKGNITLTLDGTENIKIPLGNVRHDVTVYTDGSKVWVNAEAHQTITSDYYLQGDYNGWHNWDANYKLTKIDDYTQSVTKRWSPSDFTTCAGKSRCKILKSETDWGDAIRIGNIHAASSSYSDGGGDCEDGDTRIVVKLEKLSDVTYTIWKDKNGNKKVTIKVVESTEPEPDPTYQKWSEYSGNKTWYLTGDFTKPGEFGNWRENPSEYQFADVDAYHKTISLTMDPADGSIFKKIDGHKRTRFEIINGWGNPRINRPHFDEASSHFSLVPDWVTDNEKRMAIELTQKSVVKFDIWLWGTSANNAERKVTVTITPVEKVKVSFNTKGGSTISDVEVEKGGKLTAAPTAPTKSGYIFKGWSETDGGNVVDVTTVTINAAKTFYAIWAEKVTVTFNADGGQPVPANQEIEKGGKATKPATDPAKAGYNFTGWDWNFNDAIDADKTINAQYTLKGVESVTLDKATLKLVENGATGTIAISTILPSDVLSTTTTWSSDNTGVATVNNGVVTPVAKGTANITCMVANATGSKSATCVVTVKGEDEDCEMTLSNIYTYSIEDNTTTGGTGATSNLFDPSKQSEPEKITAVQIRVGSGDNSHFAYVDPNDTHVKHGNVSSDYAWWIKEDAGDLSYATDKKSYYLKNVQTGLYLRVEDGNFGGGNWDWKYLVTTTKTDSNKDRCRWFFKTSSDQRLVNFASKKSDNNSYSTGEHFIHRESGVVSAAGTYAVAGSSDGDQGRAVLTTTFYGSKEFDNPNYKQSPIVQDSKSYYRFAEGATMTATSNMALRPGDVVTVYCYNPSSATVTGTLTIGTENKEISLTAGQTTKVEYTVTAKGATTAVLASDNEDFCVAGIEIARELPDTYKDPNLVWDTDLSGGVTQSVEAGAFTHTASSKSAGEITYSSSDTEVATVAANGTVTPVGAGTAIITASVEQEGCYAAGETSYNVTVTDLSKPTITFTTLPADVPQGSVQNIVVTTTGGAGFDLAITSGKGATLNITKKTATGITATLEIGAEATDIELTASTERTAELAQNAVKATVTVSACIPDGADIFTFTLTGSDAATGKVAGGLFGGTVDQTALGTKGTDDNPATVDVITAKTLNADGKYIGYDGGVKVVEGTGDNTKWYMIPAGRKATTSWGAKSYDLYYLYNKDAQKYLYRDNTKYTDNGDWPYYTTNASADASNARATDNKYTWFVYDSGNGKLIICGDASNLDSRPEYSYHLHTANQSVDVTNNHAPKPAVPCGRSTDINDYSKIDITTTQAANPVMIKSVEYNNKTYYIISSEGSITLHGDFKAGDVVKVDTYNRQTKTATVEEITLNADASSYTYTTSNEYVCVNNIKVWRDQVGEMINPVLTWDNIQEGATVTLNGNIQETVTHTATTSTPQVLSTITYTSSDPSVATVDANTGVVTATLSIPGNQTVTITATQGAIGCYNKATATYKVTVYNVTLEDLVNEAIAEGKTLTLPCNFNDDLTISQKLTINAQGHKIGNLTITNEGDLTLTGAMTANNLYISADQAASQHVSGQLKGADKLTLAGTAYMDLRFAAHNAVTEGWYAFTVPFKVSSTQGIYNVEEEGATKLTNETDYAIMQYQGNVRAEGKYGWIKTHKMGGMLQPGTLYIIAFGDTDYDLIRFVKASGNLNTNTVAISKFASGTATDAGWNGVGNPTLAYGNATNTGGAPHAQFLDHEGNAFIASEELITNQTYIVSSAFFIQASKNDEMSFKIPAGNVNLFAPRRAAAEDNSEFMVELSQNGKTQDRFFLSANEEASATYEIGHDLVKMGAIDGAAKVAQVAINGYGMSLCDAEFVLDDNNEAFFPLTITAPKAGEYTLSIKRACENQSIFVMDGNQVVWDLTQGDYTLSLAKGTSSNYSLLLQAAERQMPTDNQQLKANGEGVQKIILHNALRIIKNGKMYNVLGL